MGKSFIEPGDVLTFTAPSGGVTKGVPVLIGNLIVMPLDTVAQTLPFRGSTEGVHSVPKAGSQAWTVGAIVYLDNSAHVFTTTSAANYRAGVAVEAVGAGAGETTGKVRLNGIGVTVVGGAAP
jgi:predicted RecA/RadA family phage recombinase